jgi:hypothetical protein
VRRAYYSMIAMFGVAMAAQANAADQLCQELKDFVRAQEAETADPMPRHWVEYHWGIDPHAIWSWGCRDSKDASSKEFCGFLLDNTSREFRNQLPIRVQQCFGYRFPRQASGGWHMNEGEVRHQLKNGSWIVMELTSIGLQPGESAVRILYDTVDREIEPQELDPIKPLQPVAEIEPQ